MRQCAARRRRGRPRSSSWTATARARSGTFNSLIPELLDEACDFVVQDSWTEYTAFLESGADAALFVGMHARAGTRHGVMNHTVSGQVWQNLWFNGVLVGETGINAALCGNWGCPVLMVTGDDAACDEARDLLGESLTTVAVKQGLGARSARNIAPLRARALIEEGARTALADLTAVEPYLPGQPVRDPGRVQEHARPRCAPAPAGSRARQRPDDRLPGRQLVGCVAAVLLLARRVERWPMTPPLRSSAAWQALERTRTSCGRCTSASSSPPIPAGPSGSPARPRGSSSTTRRTASPTRRCGCSSRSPSRRASPSGATRCSPASRST